MPSATVLDEWLHRCIRCSNCKYLFRDYRPACPSGETFGFETYFASGRIWLARGLLTGAVKWDKSLLTPIFACTTCGNCQEQCLAPHRRHIVDMIEELRIVAAKHIGLLPAHKALLNHVNNVHNPYGEPHHAGRLAKEHSLPASAETVYFVGCTANYREQAIRDATISVLKKAKVDFTVLDEYCCGSPLLRIGQPDAAKALAAHNLKAFEATGAKRVVTSCAGCFRALKKDYPRLGVSPRVEVVHAVELADELLRDGVLQPKTAIKGVATYHDPCHLGRHMEVYDPPRRVIEALGVRLEEMPRTRAKAWCCGAGGGAKSALPEWSGQVAEQRVAEAVGTRADLLVSACPFCKRALNDARGKAYRGLRVLDVLELVDQLT